ncbi:agmatine deiminase family protein [Hwanghaeella sp.]|uniref:agmatine deiminase family protein n=1 Tax=Hwanghaeella sp. TaxID=2605943 RepID=UPI003CCBD852
MAQFETALAENTPQEAPRMAGFSMPGRFDKHEQTLISWPPAEEAANTDLEGFRCEVEALVRAVARYEPVTLIVDPADEDDARDRCGDVATVLIVPIDASWIRDNGPIFVRDSSGQVAATCFDFNGWGLRVPYAKTKGMPEAVSAALNIPSYHAPFICEGGGISVDGKGTLITTEQVMRNANRYQDWSREALERGLHDYLGIETVIWLGQGLVEDTGTDGHVDNIVEFVSPGVVMAQVTRDRSNPNFELLSENLKRLKAARDAKGRQLDIIEMDVLPYLPEINGKCAVAPYVNAYLVNGGIIAPEVDPKLDDLGYRQLEKAFPGRTVTPVPTAYQADGGGGIACLTQQVPASYASEQS